ncbi:HAMP domain-containing sensor histidine kinase [Nocardia concava]|uniref:HAMP domain-containing sensor histidine kinase n=1 Tax=Nocardia concava TaxID=257281 RepID=UPI0003010062|nr:HAMP domain-containing sensor histidine kinase [Nocardia concava]
MRRPISLQTRVAIACASVAALVIGAMAAVFLVVAKADTSRQLDRIVGSLQVTSDDAETAMPAGPARVVVVEDGSGYVWELPASGKEVAVTTSVPKSLVEQVISQKTHRILGVAVVAIVLASWLGWFVARRAVLPLRQLTAATRDVGSALRLDISAQGGTIETAELTAAMNEMLDHIAEERRNTADTLAAARDFAATSAHELRTPLTSMRTDLEVLCTVPLSDRDRTEILTEVLNAQRTVESTLFALERLAQGEMITESDWEEVDLDELIDQVAESAYRSHPGTTVVSLLTEPLHTRGLAAGLRLILDNAITNSVRHGGATRIEIGARAEGDDLIVLSVDDNGSGVAPGDRERVFHRFVRGTTETPGSGLGLALVAQQARLHNGNVRLADSPLGGARLEVTIAARAAAQRPTAAAHRAFNPPSQMASSPWTTA